ncbi:MAG TPA: hypothetical protein PK205_07055 [Promineifilum sp.]|nr:hypothetical protein [Promineifilum sp.]
MNANIGHGHVYPRPDGAVECCNCEMPHENGAQFVSYVSHLPSDPSKTDHNSVKVRNFGVKSFALASVYKAIAEWFKNDNLICLIAYNKDGEGKQWFDEPMLENLDSLEKFIQFMKKKDA